MTYEIFYTGIGGVVIGALISTLLAYWFQRIIHKEQLAAQQKSQEAFLASIKQLMEVHANANMSLKGQLHIEGQAIKEAIQNLKHGQC
jgi:hypothetical protein